MLILTPEIADQVRGVTTPGHALAPVPLKDGTFILPDAVLSDPAHEKHWDYLIKNVDVVADASIKNGTPSNPTDPLSPIIDSDLSIDAELVKATTYKETWPVGKVVAVDIVTNAVTVDGVILAEPIEVLPIDELPVKG